VSLRDVAAMDRISDNANAMGVGEAITYQPRAGVAVTIRGVWIEYPNDDRQTFGIGVQSQFSGASFDVAVADVPNLTRADTFIRPATGVAWEIDEMDLTTGVGWHIKLKRAGTSSPKGLR
jgi:hypothetical protein